MPETKIHQCQCEDCVQPDPHPRKELHHKMNLFLSRLDEQQRRWYVALESQKIGHGGDQTLCHITGMHVETIRRGHRELEASLQERLPNRVRLEGGGRPPVEKKTQR